jgi:2-oxoglutarate dehydrogenase E2 component (dihydrolipoamide succinyltransferase)
MATNIVVPELGESVVEARVAKWLKKEGDQVVAGDPLVELETEKIDLEVSADRAGVLGSIKHQEGADVKVGEVLAVLQESTNGAGASAPAAEVPPVRNEPEAPKAADKKATPTAKNVAKAHDVKMESVASEGSRVTKQDVLKATAPAPATPGAPPPPPPPAPPPPPPPPPLPAYTRSEYHSTFAQQPFSCACLAASSTS